MSTRNETIKAIKTSLQARSGKPWSVTGGRGTAYGWLKIDAPPKRQTWRFVTTDSPTPPQPGAIYNGADQITPHYWITDGSVTDYASDPWAREAYEAGRPVRFTWEVNDPAYEWGHMGPDDRRELADLLGLDTVHHQGHSVPASSDYYAEFTARARGDEPAVCGSQYWD
jgi:hypothetical protein